MRRMIVASAILMFLARAIAVQAAVAPVAVIELDGAITPVTSRLLTAAINRAQAEHDQALVVKLNTRSEEHTSELQSLRHLVCRLLLEKKKHTQKKYKPNT